MILIEIKKKNWSLNNYITKTRVTVTNKRHDHWNSGIFLMKAMAGSKECAHFSSV